jgi:hypothetical protein
MGLRELGREEVGMLRSGNMIVIVTGRSWGNGVIGRCWMYSLDEVVSRLASLVSRDLKGVRMGVKMMEWMNVMGVIMRMSAV